MFFSKSKMTVVPTWSYVEAMTQLEKEVQVEVEDAPNLEVEVAKVDRLNLRVQSGYAESLSVMWLRTLNRHR